MCRFAMMMRPVTVNGQLAAALDEGYAVGADDVDDERLGQQGLDEPAGLEEARGLSQHLKTYSIMKYVV